MGRDIRNDDTVVVRSSSIALLQERFKELQRVKVMRQQKEALRRFALPEPNYEAEAARLSFHPNADDHHHVQLLSHDHGSPSPSSLSLWPRVQLQKRERDVDEEEYYIHRRRRRRKIMNESCPLLINLWPKVITDASSSSSSSVETCSSNKLETFECESDDVDTSLHL